MQVKSGILSIQKTQTIRTLLLIDDNVAHGDAFREALLTATDGPFEGAWVTTLAEGLERLQDQEIWAVFMSLELTDGQGLETIDRLALAVPGLPTLVIVGAGEEKVGLEALKRGAKDYILEN